MVTLSGADLGGNEVSGADWAIGGERTFDGLVYRRISDDQAVYVGPAS
jgi:hypothetical protein